MKKVFLMLICLIVIQAKASDGGGFDHGNGGDMCENRIDIIRSDIVSWVLQGGSDGLKLPEGLSHDEYKAQMLARMKMAKISCTDDKIFVGAAEKTCKNFFSGPEDFIVCNIHRFMSTAESDQYVLIHHEYAGLSGFEVNQGEKSNYEISNQIAGYLEDQIVKRLVVHPKKSCDCEKHPFSGCVSHCGRGGDGSPVNSWPW